jgi:hypothetical protein
MTISLEAVSQERCSADGMHHILVTCTKMHCYAIAFQPPHGRLCTERYLKPCYPVATHSMPLHFVGGVQEVAIEGCSKSKHGGMVYGIVLAAG